MNMIPVAVYGSLLNPKTMLEICPNAKQAVWVDSAKILDFMLEFNHHLNIVPAVFDYVPVGLWWIPEEEIENLDLYEGVPSYYTRSLVEVWFEEKGTIDHIQAFVYTMNEENRNGCAPSKYYLDTVCEGYKHFNLDLYKLMYAYKTVKTTKEQE